MSSLAGLSEEPDEAVKNLLSALLTDLERVISPISLPELGRGTAAGLSFMRNSLKSKIGTANQTHHLPGGVLIVFQDFGTGFGTGNSGLVAPWLITYLFISHDVGRPSPHRRPIIGFFILFSASKQSVPSKSLSPLLLLFAVSVLKRCPKEARLKEFRLQGQCSFQESWISSVLPHDPKTPTSLQRASIRSPPLSRPSLHGPARPPQPPSCPWPWTPAQSLLTPTAAGPPNWSRSHPPSDTRLSSGELLWEVALKLLSQRHPLQLRLPFRLPFRPLLHLLLPQVEIFYKKECRN